MIGIILCGHGEFAKGLYSAIKLVAGEQEQFICVDFVNGTSSEELSVNLKKSVKQVNTGQGVVVFTDIPGGTPFNQSVIISMKCEDVKVIAGTNLPSILEVIFARECSINEFVSNALEAGKMSITEFTMKERNCDSDGI